MPEDPSSCPHMRWTHTGEVHRTTLPDGSLIAVKLAITLTCSDCGTPFWFPGMPTGESYTEPATSPDGFVATLVAVQANKSNVSHPALVNSMVRTSDILKGRRRT